MKILLTADLHGRENWYRWIATQQPELLVIAGDLTGDLGKNTQQIDFIVDQLSSLPFPVAVCSGSHDSSTEMFSRLAAAGVLTDGATAEIGKMLLTCLPHRPIEGVNDVILGLAQERRENKVWLVLHHAAPSITESTHDSGSTSILRQLRQYQPDFLACGHWHNPKYYKAWYSSVGRTKVFNPGYRLVPGDAPNCVIFDTETKVATWLDRGSLKGGPSRVEQTRFD